MSEAPGGGGGTPHQVPREELRFGVILNGGVSLAVWMGGAVLELDHLTKAAANPRSVYGRMLALTGCTARADVIAGTSAGGINGAALALSQVNKQAHLADLRDIWVDQGRIESLLRQPFRGAPTSLLRGDEFFLPRLNEALTRLAVPCDVRDAETAPIDLTITTTVLRGNQTVTVDSMGQPMPQTTHAARFHWKRMPSTPPDRDPFDGVRLERTAQRMALAARCTASFPVAFEPVFVPVRRPGGGHRPHDDASGRLTEEQRLRPDMSGVVEDWGDGAGADRSRFVVDGGLLANTPTRAALEAVEAMPASGPVRRVMLLVYPHAPEPGPDLPDREADAPSVTGTIGGLLGALTAQGSRTFVDELEHHNLVAAGRRGTRGDVLRTLTGPADLDALTVSLFPHFQRLRRWRAGRDLAGGMTGLVAGGPASGSTPDAKAPAGWNFERIRRAAEQAQDAWVRPGGGSRSEPPAVPYVPATAPTTAASSWRSGWAWGIDGALGVTEGAADLLRRLIFVLPLGDDYETVRRVRRRVSEIAGAIEAERHTVDDPWTADEVVRGLQPDTTYWTLRLAYYEWQMLGGDDGSVRRFVEAVADSEARTARAARLAQLPAGQEDDPDVVARVDREVAQPRRAEVLDTLTRLLLPVPGLERRAGEVVHDHVATLVNELATHVTPILHATVSDPPALITDELVEELRRWDVVLGDDPEVVFTRLLQLEVASTTIGDEVDTGATLPVEVVQLSAQTQNAFTRYTRTGDDKLGGMEVNRFGGFLKRSWRVNDWMWGRVDAATILARTVLQPQRLRRAAFLGGLVGSPQDAAPLARRTVQALVGDFFPEAALDDARIGDLVARAVEELTDAFDARIASGDLPAAAPALADLFAWARHLEVVPEELPALTAAIRADGVEGANARSRGEVFLHEQKPLLDRIEQARGSEVAGEDRIDALAAFDRAGVGREPLRDEASSDLTLRTATTAAAVTATVLDSGRAGLGAVRPVTRALRGGVMLPYWVVTALTARAALARALALLGLTVGAVLLALALFGVLPEQLSGPATAIGGSAVLVALAYGALRSGTMLHGLVLLTPVVPLVAYAFAQGRDAAEGSDGASAAQGFATLAVVLALALGLMILGSLPAATGSVWASLDRLAARYAIPEPPDGTGPAHGLANAWRRTRGVGHAAVRLLPAASVAALVVVVATWLVGAPWLEIYAFLRRNAVVLAVVAVVLLAIGAWAAWRFGRLLQVLRQVGDGDAEAWQYATLAHPAGAAAGWAVLYGAVYLGLAAFLVWDPADWQQTAWARALLAMAILLGVGLGAGYPLLAPFRALRDTERREVARARTVGPPSPTDLPHDGPGPDTDVAAVRSRALAVDLATRGVAYRWLVSDRPAAGNRPPSLTRRGVRLERRVTAVRFSLDGTGPEHTTSDRTIPEARTGQPPHGGTAPRDREDVSG